MSEEIYSEDNKSKRYQDMITHKPKLVRFISEEEVELIRKYSQIIRALRNTHLTVKEIHELYLDDETGKHTLTLKTVYKHVEKLENANLIKVSGHRMTEGNRQTEKLYTRTGNIFFPDMREELPEGNVEERKVYTESMNTVMSEMLNVPKSDEKSFYDFYMLLRKHKYQINIEILEKAKSSKKTAEILTKTNLDKLNKMTETISTLLTFLRHPEILEKLRNLYN
ncbi:MAG: hypothetical protein JSW11_01510 [Candidatus Heimdallarchaeota archaeon]|nr:MAG: hypothetical protein JSW11_01510 [Candidatus Heimdallarchaeota archaeon]